MIDITKIRIASDELLDDSDPIVPPDDSNSHKVKLALKLESQGKKTICVGRALITIERCESDTELPESLTGNWGVLKISIYSDPELTGHENPQFIYINGGRYGLDKLSYENGNIFKIIDFLG